MNIYSLPSIISFTVNFSIALILLMDNPKVSLNRWLAAFIFSFAVWNLAEALILNTANFSTALFGAQILYRIIFLSPSFYVIIAYLFPKNFSKFAMNPIFPIAVFLLPILVLILSVPDFQIELIALREVPRTYYYHFRLNFRPLFLMLLFIAISYIVWGSIVLGAKIRQLRTIRLKNQTRFFLFGMIIIFVSFVAINLLKTYLHNRATFYFLSTIFTFVIAIFFFVATARFHLFKPEKLLSGGITYTVLPILTFAAYFFVIREASATLKLWIGINSSLFDALLTVFLIFMILPFEKRLQRLFERWIDKDMSQGRKNILIFFRRLQRYYERDEFFKIVVPFIKEYFKSSAVYVFHYQRESDNFIEISSKEIIMPLQGNSPLIKALRRKKTVAEFYELEHDEFSEECRHFLGNIHARFLVPIIYENSLLAILVLCRKKYGLEYSENEREVLSILANEIAASLRRNQIIEEVRENDRRRLQLEKFAVIGEFAASIAHEIRNPLNTISTSAETLLRKDVSVADQDELKQFIMEEANRLNRILSDFLNFARIRQAVYSEVDMENMFERLCLALQNANEIGITVYYEMDAAQKMILSDPDLLFQALLNLGLNGLAAVKERYQSEGGFTSEDGVIKCAMKKDENHVILSVMDNGSGISPQISGSIYNPFFTTREDGTGLGLSIVHQIVEVLHGSIEFTSRRGHTCFSIHLPKQTS